MPRYIDGDALKKRMFSYYDCVSESTGKESYRGETLMNYEVADMIEDCIDNAPTADVVEVVRCRDCKECKIARADMPWCDFWAQITRLNGYCHRGERREEQ